MHVGNLAHVTQCRDASFHRLVTELFHVAATFTEASCILFSRDDFESGRPHFCNHHVNAVGSNVYGSNRARPDAHKAASLTSSVISLCCEWMIAPASARTSLFFPCMKTWSAI